MPGQTRALDEALREQADALHEEKQRLIVEREQVRIELAACEDGDINTARVGQALKKFSDLLPTLSPDEQRDLVTLFLERVEIRPASDKVAKVGVGTRLLELRLKLRVERLVEGMAEQIPEVEQLIRDEPPPAGGEPRQARGEFRAPEGRIRAAQTTIATPSKRLTMLSLREAGPRRTALGNGSDDLPDCHREERSDVAINLKCLLDCRARQPGLAMTDQLISPV